MPHHRPTVCSSLLLLALSGPALFGPALAADLPAPRTLVVETKALPIDGIYRSMAGPYDRVTVEADAIDWVTAFKSEVVELDSGKTMGEEFFCHSQLQLPDGTRPLVAATGLSEIRFPSGFGLALHESVDRFASTAGGDDSPLSFVGMVLNNHEPDLDTRVSVRARIEYLTSEDVGNPPRLKKLATALIPMTVENLEAYDAPAPHDGPDADDHVATHCALVNGLVNHWMVPPGPQRTRKRFSGSFLGSDHRVHLAAVHLHNYGRYLRLTDLTRDQVLWQTDAVYESDRLQIAEIPVYSSEQGFLMPADHEYEIEAFYDNTTDADIDAMAMLYLYLHPAGDVADHNP